MSFKFLLNEPEGCGEALGGGAGGVSLPPVPPGLPADPDLTPRHPHRQTLSRVPAIQQEFGLWVCSEVMHYFEQSSLTRHTDPLLSTDA